MPAPYDIQLQRLAETAREPASPPDELRRAYEQVIPFIERSDGTKVRRETRELAFSVLSAIAANPNTPLPTLAKAVGYAPRAFCSNPVAPLITLEDPNWTRLLSEWSLRRLLRLSTVPPQLVLSVTQGIVDNDRLYDYLRDNRVFQPRDAELASRVCPAALPHLSGAAQPPIVREARNHITSSPEIDSLQAWREAVQITVFVAEVSGQRRSAEEEWGPALWRKNLSAGWRHRRCSAPGPQADRDSWWVRLGIAEGARPLLGHAWVPPMRTLLHELADDGHRLVRFAARARLAEPERDLWRD